MNKLTKILITILIILSLNYNIVKAEEFTITSKKVVLYNLNDNNIIYEQDKDKKVQIASLTKIMTTIVAIENIDNLDKEVTITWDMFKGIEEYSKAGFQIGDIVTYKDLLYGIMLPSGADAVNAIVLSIKNNEEEFVSLMNNKAQELNLTNTHFDNPIGMDSAGDDLTNYSTANDLANLLLYALKNDTFKEIFTTRTYTVPSTKLVLKSTLTTYSAYSNLDVSNIKGAKSGFTDGAGLCLASISTINDVDYLLINLGSSTNNKANAVKDSLTLYNYYSSNYSYKEVLKKGQIITTIPVKWSTIKEYGITSPSTKELYLKNDIDLNKIEYNYQGLTELTPKIKKDTKLGTIEIKYDDKILDTVDIYLTENIKYSHIFIYIIIILLILLIIFTKKRRKKHIKRKIKSKK